MDRRARFPAWTGGAGRFSVAQRERKRRGRAMLLYDAAWAPSPRRVRLFLAEKGLTLERRLLDLRADEQRGADYLRVNPRGSVPALVLDDGQVVTESSAICRYLEALHPDPPLFGGTDPLAVARVEEWTRRIEGEGYAAAVYALRNGNPAFAGRGLSGHWPEVAQVPELADRARLLWRGITAALNSHLADREWIATARYTYADLTALVTVDFARAAGLPLPPELAHLTRWHAAAAARPSAAA
jgi:glutathione S-transferase